VPFEFEEALRAAETLFVVYERDGALETIWFADPSIRDFVISRLSEDQPALVRMLDSLSYWDQVEFFLNVSISRQSRGEPNTLHKLSQQLHRYGGRIVDRGVALFGERCYAAGDGQLFEQELGRMKRGAAWDSDERRLMKLLQAQEQFGIQRDGGIDDLLRVIIDAWSNGYGSKKDAIDVADAILNWGESYSVADEMVRGLKHWFTGTCDTFDDFELLLELYGTMRPSEDDLAEAAVIHKQLVSNLEDGLVLIGEVQQLSQLEEQASGVGVPLQPATERLMMSAQPRRDNDLGGLRLWDLDTVATLPPSQSKIGDELDQVFGTVDKMLDA
jgi:hypothetical protein